MWPLTSSYPEVDINSLYEEYDFIVVGESVSHRHCLVISSYKCPGGGTSGCVLANRLSADPSKSVLVIERGPRADSWTSRVPLFSSDFASDGSRTLKRTSEYQQELGRPIQLYSGGALGGSSRVNQMLYTRGLPAEYDRWSDAGRTGWSWKELRPFFLKSECSLSGAVEGVHAVDGIAFVISKGVSYKTNYATGEWKNRIMDKFYFPCFGE